MVIVSWNCCGRFREKYKLISSLNADIYVIQECEDPNQSNNVGYKEFAKNSIWIGVNKHKGVGIFAKPEINIKKNNWKQYCLREFVSVKINNSFDLIGVWACKPYIEEYYVYQSIHKNKFNKNTIIIGDFNSSKNWDSEHRFRNHSAVVNELLEKDLISAYHFVYNEEQGEETSSTFYLYRHLDRGYHLDYCFLNKEKIGDFKVLEPDDWISVSDHVPIILFLK